MFKKWVTAIAIGIASIGITTSIMADSLDDVISGAHRGAVNVSRDQYRHPAETLRFFDIQADMSVVEIWPGGGWYTEILAPYLKQQGTFYAGHFSEDNALEYFRKSREGFDKKLLDEPEQYSNVKIAVFDPGKQVLSVPSGSVDRVLTFRNVHNWLRDNSEAQAFILFFEALKPGGILGVVDHRAIAGTDRDTMLTSGYMDQKRVVELAVQAGFVLSDSSEINANAKDSKRHEMGVWTLPPRLRMGDENREHYLKIGESDRMTLRFIKPLVTTDVEHD